MPSNSPPAVPTTGSNARVKYTLDPPKKRKTRRWWRSADPSKTTSASMASHGGAHSDVCTAGDGSNLAPSDAGSQTADRMEPASPAKKPKNSGSIRVLEGVSKLPCNNTSSAEDSVSALTAMPGSAPSCAPTFPTDRWHTRTVVSVNTLTLTRYRTTFLQRRLCGYDYIITVNVVKHLDGSSFSERYFSKEAREDGADKEMLKRTVADMLLHDDNLWNLIIEAENAAPVDILGPGFEDDGADWAEEAAPALA